MTVNDDGQMCSHHQPTIGIIASPIGHVKPNPTRQSHQTLVLPCRGTSDFAGHLGNRPVSW